MSIEPREKNCSRDRYKYNMQDVTLGRWRIQFYTSEKWETFINSSVFDLGINVYLYLGPSGLGYK